MALKIRPKDSPNDHYRRQEAIKEATSEKMVTLTILVPESLREKLKVKAIQNKTNVTNVLLKYIHEYIEIPTKGKLND